MLREKLNHLQRIDFNLNSFLLLICQLFNSCRVRKIQEHKKLFTIMLYNEEKPHFSNDIPVSRKTNTEEPDSSEEDIESYKWMFSLFLIIWVLTLLIYSFSES